MATSNDGITTGLSDTPQAKDDIFAIAALNENSTATFILSVMANDAGGQAKILYSLDDGIENEGSATSADLLTQDVVGVDNSSTFGALIEITATGKVAYTMTAASTAYFQSLGANEIGLDTFTYAIRLANGTLSWATVTVQIKGMNDAAIISGISTVSLTETDAVLTTSGTLSATDIDSSAAFVAQTGVAGSNGYGVFSIDAIGVWTYSTNGAHNEFVSGIDYTDSFTVTTADGTTQVVTVILTGTSESGIVADGYISNALVFSDANDNQIWDHEQFTDANDNGIFDIGEAFIDADSDGLFTAEAFVVTDAGGNFTNLGGAGKIVSAPITNAAGNILTIDISTGLEAWQVLSAPAGSQVINPLTTLMASLVGANATAAEIATAQETVTQALGITLTAGIQLTTYDPLAVLAGTGTAVEMAEALGVQQAAAVLADLVAVLTSAIIVADPTATPSSAQNLVAAALSAAVAAPGASVDLTQAATITAILNAAASGLSADAQSQIALDSGQIAAFLAGSNLSIYQSTSAAEIAALQAAVLSPNHAPVLAAGGNTIIDVGGSTDQATSMTLQADGKILMAGWSFNTSSSDYDFSLIRLNTDGSLDATFDGDGKTIIPVGSSYDQATSMTLQADGKILVSGYSYNATNDNDVDFSLIRLNADGSLDATFDGDGKAIIDVGGSTDFATSVMLQADGKVLLAGMSYNPASGDYDFGLIRLNADGSLDATFDGDGRAMIDVGGSYDQANSMTLQADGKVLVAGQSYNPASGDYDFSLIRLNADGSLDATFDGDGKAIIDVGGSTDFATSMTLQADGKILLAGMSYNPASGDTDFSRIRLNADGSLDTTFDGDGKTIIPVGPSIDFATSITLQADGKILLAGYSTNPASGDTDYSLLRLNADGSLDTSFVNTALAGISAAFVENGAPVVLNGRASVFDADLAVQGNYGGASLTLTRSGGANTQDLFSASGTLAALTEGGILSVGGIAIGTVAINSGGMLTLNFDSNATQALVNGALQQIAYSNSSDSPPASVTIDWSFKDGNAGAQGLGGALTATGSTTVLITALNDAPVITSHAMLAGGEGRALIIPVGTSDDVATSMTLQADGKILVAGYSATNPATGDQDFSLIRLNTDGSLDATFDGDGKAIIDVGGSQDIATSMTLQADGKILVAGYSVNFTIGNYDFSLLRLNADGSLDTTFDGDGRAIIDVGGSYNFATSMTVQADGRILGAGTRYNAALSNSEFSLLRLNADGSLDTTFDGDGQAIIPVVVASSDYSFASMVLQADGKILGAGTSYDIIGNWDFSLLRLNADGSLDATFDGVGKVLIDVGGSYDQATSMTLQADGKILVAGNSTNPSTGDQDFSLIRLNADGSLDATFDGDGKAIIDVGGSTDFATSVTLQADGKILLAGYSTNPASGDTDFSLIRLNADGSLDTTFDGDGRAIIDVVGVYDFATSVTLQADGKILVAGSSDNRFSLIRLNADGSLDTSFVNTALAGISAAFVENGVPVVLNGQASVFDAELAAQGHYGGASLTLTRSGGANAQDLFSGSGTLAALTEGGILSVEGIAIGTVTTNSGGTLALNFDSGATQALVNGALQQIAYSNSSDSPPTSVTIDWSFNDGNAGAQGLGGALTATGSTTVLMTALNDPDQVITGSGGVDVLSGGSGDDILIGNASNDILTGGPGSDRFDYNSVFDGTDTITDFTLGAGGDVLDLTDVLGSFTGISPTHDNAFTGGFLQFVASGTDTLVQVDSDGGGDSYSSLAVLTNTLLLSTDTNNYLL